MNPIKAAMKHCRLNADIDAASAYGDGWWIQEALGALTRFVEERYAHKIPQVRSCRRQATPPRSTPALDIV